MTSGEYGKLYKSAWGDRDFKALNEGEQALYHKLVSQSDTSLAGVLTYAPTRWAGQTAGLTVTDIEARLAGLVRGRYIVIDLDTQEVLIRSYIRNDSGWRSPRTMIGIANSVRRILSVGLRSVISAELARIDTAGLSESVSDKTNRSTRQVVDAAIRGLIEEVPDDKQSADTLSIGYLEHVEANAADRVSIGYPAFAHTTATANTTAVATATAVIRDALDDEPENLLPAVVDTTTDVVAKTTTRRGSRLPDDWSPARTDSNLAAEAPHDRAWLSDQLERFRDYWAGTPGARGTKLDWDATWRNWIRNSKDRQPQRRMSRMGDLTNDDWAAAAARLQERTGS